MSRAWMPLAGALFWAVAAHAAPTADIPEALRGDTRLQQEVTLVLRDEPMDRALRRLGATLGVELRATRDTADDRVTLAVRDRSAAELLGRVARHFDFDWVKSGRQYELRQSLKSKQREQAMREGELERWLVEIHAHLEQVAALGSKSPAELNARLEQLGQMGGDGPSDPERERARRRETAAIRDRLRPGAAAAVRLYRGLSPAQLQLLRNGGEVRFSSAGGTLPTGLGDQIHDIAREAAASRMGSLSMTRTLRIAPGGAPPPPTAALPQPEALENLPTLQADAAVRLGGGPLLRPGPAAEGSAARPPLEFTFTSVRGREGERRSMPVRWSPSPPPSALERSDLPAATNDPDLLQKVDLGLRGGAGSGGTAPRPGVLSVGLVPAFGGTPGAISLAEVAARIHQAAGLEFVGDGFIRARIQPSRLADTGTVFDVLNRVARELGYTWSKEGKLITLRSRDWFQDRPASVPERVVGPWKERVDRQGGVPTLDDLAQLAAALTDPQAEGMSSYWNWYLEGSKIEALPNPGGIYQPRHHLRFWAMLNAGQRQAALRGEVLPIARMLPPQRQAFAVAFTSPSDGRFGPMEGGGGQATPQELAAGGFSLSRNEMQQMSFTGPAGEGGRPSVGIMLFGAGGGAGPGGGRPPVPGLPPGTRLPMITGPNGEALNLSAAGPIQTLDAFQFRYHLAGRGEPARTAQVMVPRPKPAAAAPTR